MSAIKEARTAKGWSRAELARRLGAPIRTLEDWEAGRRTPPEQPEKSGCFFAPKIPPGIAADPRQAVRIDKYKRVLYTCKRA